jgi:hypothetical protein
LLAEDFDVFMQRTVAVGEGRGCHLAVGSLGGKF